MVKVFITYLERVLSGEGKKKAQYRPYFRTIEDGRSIKGEPITIKHIVPTCPMLLGHGGFYRFREMMEQYKKMFSEQGIDAYLGDADAFFYAGHDTKDEDVRIRNFVWHAEMPHLSENQQKRILPKQFITGHENKVTRLAQWRIGVPYKIYDYDESTRKIARGAGAISIEHLLREKKCAIDIETENWKKTELDQRTLMMRDEELMQFYSKLAEQTKTSVHPEHLQHWQRKDYLKKLDELVDSLRQEKILSAQYITFRDNDTVVHTFDCIKDLAEFEVNTPGTEEKRKIKLACANDSTGLGERLTQIMQADDPLFVFGTNHLNFDYKKLDTLTGGKFRPGIGNRALKYSANIVKDFLQRRIIPGRFDIDTFTYSMQSSWTFRNNLDTTFNYMLGKNEKKTLNYDELIIKTQQARQGNREAALEILYYAAQDAMKSYMLGDHMLEEILCESKQYSAPTYKVSTTAKRTLVDDKIQQQSWSRLKTYRRFNTLAERWGQKISVMSDDELRNFYIQQAEHAGIPVKQEQMKHWQSDEYLKQIERHVASYKLFDLTEAKAWEDFSVYDSFWDAFKRQMNIQSFRPKKGIFTAHVIFPTLYYKTLIPVIEKTAGETIAAMEKTADQKKKIRLMEYLNSDLEWVLYSLKKEYINSCKKGSDRDINDLNFRKYFGVGKNTGEIIMDTYIKELQQRMALLCDCLKSSEIINHSERFLVLEQNLLSEGIVKRLEEEELAIALGRGRVLSDTKGRFIALIDGQIISQGIDPEGKRNRCEYETFIIQGVLQRALELNDPREALRFADGQIKLFYKNSIPDEALKCKKTARMNYYHRSDRSTQRFSNEAVQQQILKGEKYEYTRTEEEMFGGDGSIKNILSMRFPVRKLEGSALGRMLSGDGNEAVFEEIINAASRKS